MTVNAAPAKPKQSKPLKQRTIVRKFLFIAPVRIGRFLVRKRWPKTALAAIRLTARLYPEDPRVLHIQSNAYEGIGNFKAGDRLRARRLRHLMVPHMKAKDFTEILKIMAEMERTHQAAQFQAGRLIAQQLNSERGRARILSCALKAQKRFRESAYLTHLITLCQAMDGEYRKASTTLIEEIKNPYKAPTKLKEKRQRILQQSWRVVDLVARERMDWADENNHSEKTGDNIPANTSCQIESAVPDITPGPVVSFKEHALQGRQREAYLKACDEDFEGAPTLIKKLLAVEEMMRAGIRHIPDYTASYEQARTRLTGMADELEFLFLPDSMANPALAARSVMELCTYHNLAHRLGLDAQKSRVVDRLDTLSEDASLAGALWPAPGAIARDMNNVETSYRIMDRIKNTPPKINRDVQNYFRWAMMTRHYKEADAFYANIPKQLHRRHGLLYYVNILQRQSRFSEALKLLIDIHGQLLANPSQLNGFSNHSLIKRNGELRFLIETKKIYATVKQPKEPKGVLLISPRNIDQLRRYPLMVLLEFKRRGWAVIPLVEGLLPVENTGIAEIDVMNSAIGATTKLSNQAVEVMPELTDFTLDAAKGSLKWGNIDLSHSVWEDAAINRRRYTLNWECPELQHYLTGLAGWANVMGRVLSYAHSQHKKTGLKTGSVSLFNCRLPDSVFRFYCEEFGDPDGFFYLHTANGYQNYFTNFSTNISQRLVLRNMTRYPTVRSGSFPIPAFFKTYYQENQDRIPDIMERFAAITKVKRSTQGDVARPAKADAVDARISEWRARGGKVACAFGKVVCDSSVPFDGGPAHKNMKDWINHCIATVQGTDTLLLIKPHPHELNNQIATFPTEYFEDLLTEPLGENVILLGHRWFDMHDMGARMDLGLIYNGTTAIELGIMNIPCVLAGHFAPVDYPVGHAVPKDRADFEAYLRFEKKARKPRDLRQRSAVWLDYMANEDFTQSYRYHARPVTNKVLYPPFWFQDDLDKHQGVPDPSVIELTGRALGERLEPGGAPVKKREPAAAKKPAVHKRARAPQKRLVK